MKAALQVFSYDEPYEQLTETMDSYAGLDTPDWVDIDYFGAVTPRISAHHPDAVRDHPWFELIETPQGKLSSRNVAHEYAVNNGYDLIIVCDTDALPLSDETLYSLIEPYENPDVVATNSTPLAFNPLGIVVNVIGSVEDTVRPHMHGQLSSFTTDAWRQVGPFDESVDQTNVQKVRKVEEFRLYHQLKQLGTVKRVPEAQVYNDTRRVTCMLEDVRPTGPNRDFCKRRGIETFERER